MGELALDFLQELGRRIASSTAEPRTFSFLMQRLSVAVQRGNAVCVTGTAPSSSSLDTLHYYEDEAVRRRRPAGRCMLDNAQTLSCCYFIRYFYRAAWNATRSYDEISVRPSVCL